VADDEEIALLVRAGDGCGVGRCVVSSTSIEVLRIGKSKLKIMVLVRR